MKAIFTKYHGSTNTRRSRISASDSDGNRVTISYPYELSGEAVHRKAADTLCEKMNWGGELVSGWHRNGYVFVFANVPCGQLVTPQLKRVTGPAFGCKCCDCGRTYVAGSEHYKAGRELVMPDKMWADLAGEPFKAYYCEPCVFALASGLPRTGQVMRETSNG